MTETGENMQDNDASESEGVNTGPLDRQPVLVAGGVTSLVNLVVVLGLAFGFSVDANQVATVAAGLAVLMPIVAALWGRMRSWSPESVRTMQQSWMALLDDQSDDAERQPTALTIIPDDASENVDDDPTYDPER